VIEYPAMRQEVELYTSLDNDRYLAERPAYGDIWKEDVDIRFGMVYESLSGGVGRHYYGLGMVGRIGYGDLFDSIGLVKYVVDGQEIEAFGYNGGTATRDNILRPTGRVISVEEYARLMRATHEATVRKRGEKLIRDTGYWLTDEQLREKSLQHVRSALEELKKGSRVLPGVEIPLPF
jgi:hypothetical protein